MRSNRQRPNTCHTGVLVRDIGANGEQEIFKRQTSKIYEKQESLDTGSPIIPSEEIKMYLL